MKQGLTQAIRTTMMDYTKKSFEDGTRAFEQLVGTKSIEQVWEIQSQYAKKAFEAYRPQASKIGEMYYFIFDLLGCAALDQPVRNEPLPRRRLAEEGCVNRPRCSIQKPDLLRNSLGVD